MGDVVLEGVGPFDLPGVTTVEVTTYGSRIVLNLRLPGDGSVGAGERILTVPLRAKTALSLARALAEVTEDLDLDEKLPDTIRPEEGDILRRR
jgi:hypothetical protein